MKYELSEAGKFTGQVKEVIENHPKGITARLVIAEMDKSHNVPQWATQAALKVLEEQGEIKRVISVGPNASKDVAYLPIKPAVATTS